jgi:pyruvate/2-oxoglutarate dehydrogenase complex dihydrolipoamide dehydrogenase (E3) component
VGGLARRIPFPDGKHVLTHSDWAMKGLPQSVVVVGGAVTGCQLASVFAAFGSRGWLLEVAPPSSRG